jgi:hypothetical protein
MFVKRELAPPRSNVSVLRETYQDTERRLIERRVFIAIIVGKQLMVIEKII